MPDHLKDSHYAGAQKLGHGLGYQYPHDHADGWVEQQYLPDVLKDKQYYRPTPRDKNKVVKKYRG